MGISVTISSPLRVSCPLSLVIGPCRWPFPLASLQSMSENPASNAVCGRDADCCCSCATKEQRINSPSSIARALAVFSVDEVVLYDDRPTSSRAKAVDEEAYTGDVDPCHYIAHILSYLETPPFMRKTLFPIHPNLRLQGLLPSLDMPHHPHKDEWLPYREGMTLPDKPKSGKGFVSNPVVCFWPI
jgi:hypothetical protein